MLIALAPAPARTRLRAPYVVAGVALAGYAAWSLQRLRTFDASGFDLGIFEQAVRSYAHGHWPGQHDRRTAPHRRLTRSRLRLRRRLHGTRPRRTGLGGQTHTVRFCAIRPLNRPCPANRDIQTKYGLQHTIVAGKETRDRPIQTQRRRTPRRPNRTRTHIDTATADRICPYAGNKSGWPEQRARFAALPTETAQHVIDEYVCLALNPRSGLFGPGKSLITRLHRDQVTEPITLAVARMKTMPWAIYRVRRLYYAPANAIRSVDGVLLGGHRAVHTALTEVSRFVDIPLTKNEEIAGAPVRDGDRDTHRRLWLRRRCDGIYPTQEEFYTVTPAQAQDKGARQVRQRLGRPHRRGAWAGWNAASTRPSPSCSKPSSTATAAATRPEPLTEISVLLKGYRHVSVRPATCAH